MGRLFRFSLSWGFFMVAFASIGQANEAGQDPRVAAAKTACAAGDYQQGVRLLAELYTATNDPIWIFNQGRCYHQNNQFPQAIARFKEFLRKNVGGPAEDNRDAQNYINEIEAETRKADVPSGSPPPPAAAIAVPKDEPATRNDGRRLRYAGIGSFAVAGVGLVSGVIFTLLKQKAERDVESQTAKSVPYSEISGTMSDGQTYATLQWVGYGVGAAALVTGGVLYYLGSKASHAATPPDAAPATALTPFVGKDIAGVLVHRTF